MSIAVHNRIKLLEARVLALEGRIEELETKPEPFVNPLPAFEPKRGRPPKVKDGH